MTIKKIAALAGVSTAAVSAVLNNRWKEIRLTEKTRDRIEEVLKKHHYQPHMVGKALVVRRSLVIGMVVEKINFSFLPEALEGVEDLTEQKDYGLLLMTTRQSDSREEKVLNFLLARSVDGIILGPGVDIPKSLQPTLTARNTPVVYLGRQEDKHAFVCVDGHQIGYLGIQHLIARGHRTIGCWNMQSLMGKGIDRAVAESGEKIQITHWPACPPREIITLWLNADPRPTALFVNGDDAACRLLHLALRRGVRIPEELAIVGVDDIPAAEEAAIPMTTVAQPKHEQGLAAVELLFDLMEGRPAKSIILQPTLVVRETT